MSKKFWANIFIIFFIFWLCLPFVMTVFYDNTGSVFVSLILNFISVFFLVIGYIVYRVIEERKNFKRNVLIVICAVIFIFFVSYKYQMHAGDFVFFKLREKKFTEFAQSIRNYGKITQMTSDKEYARKLNNKLFGYTEQEIKKKGPYSFSLYNKLLDSLNIDETIHKDFFKRLDGVDCKSFEIKDNVIIFTTDASLGNCYGVAFSENGDHPEKVDCGKIKEWRELTENWYAWKQ
ncbi:MAG: hypothetical protein K1X86_09030 [Ignavibacteria bacterium]|nr:hypothetical protein [Ignavibacteria bacterium]